MRLTTFTDYSLRVLIFLGLKGEKLSTIGEIAEAYGVSQNHLMKIVHHLAGLGTVETIRGKGGGIRLAKDPAAIRLGAVVRACETSVHFAECFDPDHSCCIDGACMLKGIFHTAGEAFFGVLDSYTLADLLRMREPLRARLGLARDQAPAAAT